MDEEEGKDERSRFQQGYILISSPHVYETRRAACERPTPYFFARRPIEKQDFRSGRVRGSSRSHNSLPFRS
jgi:hypothetical protein